MIYRTVAGTTGDEDFQLLEDGAPVGIEGFDVDLLLWDKYGVAVTTTDDVENLDDGTEGKRGKVRVNLDVADLVAERGPYTARFQVTDLAGKIVYFPTDDADVWIVGRGAA